MKSFAIFCLCLSAVLAGPAQKITNKIFLKDIESRIINGERAREGQFPWQVGLYMGGDDGYWFCGGSIISEQWILTAGHCVNGSSSGTVIAGVVDINDPQSQELEADGFILHGGYGEERVGNDIGLIKLRQSLSLGGNIQSIRLAEEPLGDNVEVTVSGWGLTSDNASDISEFLNFVQLRTIPKNECEEYYGGLPEEIVCANSESDQHKSSCSGDSGGPVVTDAESNPVIVALVTFGSEAGCEVGAPSGYTRTAYYRDWIRKNTGI